jgi:hypothetical protein
MEATVQTDPAPPELVSAVREAAAANVTWMACAIDRDHDVRHRAADAFRAASSAAHTALDRWIDQLAQADQ